MSNVIELYSGLPCTRNSEPLETLNGYTVGETVDVIGRTIGRCKIATLFRRNIGFCAEVARVVSPEGKYLDVLTSELAHVVRRESK